MLQQLTLISLTLLVLGYCTQCNLPVWPYPQTTNCGSNNYIKVNTLHYQINPKEKEGDMIPHLREAVERYFKYYLFTGEGTRSYKSNIYFDPFPIGGNCLGVLEFLEVTVQNPMADLEVGVDERYLLRVEKRDDDFYALIEAETVWGALRGLETFSQLIEWRVPPGESEEVYVVRNLPIEIIDSPRFAWRGVMVDTSRHFFELQDLLRIIDGMMFNKMNIFHWHLTDAESFPFQSEVYPGLSEQGAYSENAVYSHGDIKTVIEYAYKRGIIVVPEIDMPGHTGSWGKHFPEIVADCWDWIKEKYGPVPGWPSFNLLALDPTKQKTYDVVKNLLGEITGLFKSPYVHLGGDEVSHCWAFDKNISKWMRENGYATLENGTYIYDIGKVQDYFEEKVENFVSDLKKTSIVWGEKLFSSKSLNNDTIIQLWHERESLTKYLDEGRQVIVSLDYYVDRQSPICSGHNCTVWWLWIWTWRDMYLSDPVPEGLTPEQEDQILGGELCSWSESVNGATVDNRIWTRGIAVAERLWSKKTVNNVNEAQPRASTFQCHMRRRGLKTGPTEPSYCQISDNSQSGSRLSTDIWILISSIQLTIIIILLIALITAIYKRRPGYSIISTVQ